MAETFELTVGEVMVLCRSCPGHLVGEVFDPIEDVRKVDQVGQQATRRPESYGTFVRSLIDKGLLAGTVSECSVTERGEATWKALVPKWHKARYASGISGSEG